MRKSLAASCLGLVLVCTIAATPAVAETRVALVIGNGAYENAPHLANPPRDARLISATLGRLGFEVIERINVDQRDMKRAILEFGRRLTEAGVGGVGLFYYAGHGAQVDGRNYMIPLRSQIVSEADVDLEAVPAETVLSQMEYARTRLNFVILDACRNNPFARSFRTVTRGLARMDAPRGTLIAYATAPGEVAEDGGGDNSPYTAALAEQLLSPGMQAEEMFRKVRLSVMRATGERQTPWEASSLTGAFYFGGAAPELANVKSDVTPSLRPPPRPLPDVDVEVVFWQSVETSKRVEDYQAYLERFPYGAFAPLARSRVAALSKPTEASAPPPQREVKPTPSPYPHDGTWNGWLRTYGGSFNVPVEANFQVVVNKGQLRGQVRMYGETRTISAQVANDGSLIGGRLEGRNSYSLHGTVIRGRGDGAIFGWKLEYKMSRAQ